ncbi:hypothetical protein Tco_0294633 [Tanacetum coccineum]
MLGDTKLAGLLADLRSSLENSIYGDCILGVLFIIYVLDLLDMYHSNSEGLICNNSKPCDVTRLVLAQVSYLLSEDVVALCFNAFITLYIDTLCYDDQTLCHASSFCLSRGVTLLLKAAEVFKKTIAEGENPPNALVLHALVEKSSKKSTSEKKVSDDEPLVKKLKFLLPTSSSILSPTPLNSILPKPVQKPDATTMKIEQFTEHLSKTTSSIFSPTPPREPTSPKDKSKGKGIATEEPLKEIMPFMEEGGSVPKMPNFKSFSTPDGQMTNDDVMAQLKEMKRLADLKDEKEKLKTLGFSEWIEVHALASKTKKEGFHLATTPHLIRLQNGILRGTPEAEEFFKKMELTIEARDDANQARKIIQDKLDGLGQNVSAGIKGLAECKSSVSNLRRIQVKDIIKEFKDHLKTYSSAGMDISWYVEGIRCGSKDNQRWQYLDCPVTL